MISHIKRILVVGMSAIWLVGTSARAEEPAPAHERSTVQQVKETVKSGAATAGQAVRDATRAVGHGFRDAAKAIGHGTRDAVQSVKKAVEEETK